MNEKLKIGISACLLGKKVRYNGGHKKFELLEKMTDYFDFISVCPEVAIGMGVPRPAVKLLKKDHNIQLVQSKDVAVEFTSEMSLFSNKFCHDLPDDLCGFIVKKTSPTCAKDDAKIYSEKGHPIDKSSGMFTSTLLSANPLLPIEDEGRLHDQGLRDLFFKKVYATYRILIISRNGYKPEHIVNFHRDYKYLIMSHNPAVVPILGNLISNLGGCSDDVRAIFEDYIRLFMESISFSVERKHMTVTLQHVSGYFKKYLDRDEVDELYCSIMRYSKHEESLISPITLMKHYIRKYNIEYLDKQYFFNPYPEELMRDFI